MVVMQRPLGLTSGSWPKFLIILTLGKYQSRILIILWHSFNYGLSSKYHTIFEIYKGI